MAADVRAAWIEGSIGYEPRARSVGGSYLMLPSIHEPAFGRRHRR